jgi:hypothetical protein
MPSGTYSMAIIANTRATGSESDVRITDISVRSALKRVPWNDMPVRATTTRSKYQPKMILT